MNFLEALEAVREGMWIRPIEEGKIHPHRWIRKQPTSEELSYVFSDRPTVEQRAYIQPGMGSIDRYFADWEAIPSPNKQLTKRK